MHIVRRTPNLLARTDSTGRKHEGLSEFVVDMSTSGIEVSPITDMAGEHHFNEVTFTDVFVPEHRLLGTEGNGSRQVIEQLSFERGGPERVLSTIRSWPKRSTICAAPLTSVTMSNSVRWSPAWPPCGDSAGRSPMPSTPAARRSWRRRV
jgi:hypothetical protein